MAINDELLDQLMEGLDRPEDLLGDKGLLQELKKDLIERALGPSSLTISAMSETIPPGVAPAIPATTRARRRSGTRTARSRYPFPVTARAPSSPS
ncbi:hypothetical protein FAK_09340 [Desulfoferula mesophila]|uniref:Transposase n=1 Tax=Desulfoferula mesophila TaxID=3058419 RepID=A0AAU9E9X0_9BACT|nr:hypothetical protein FAK_09340 [Desulfoferula mesophilus]